jgi:hypothetical protein
LGKNNVSPTERPRQVFQSGVSPAPVKKQDRAAPEGPEKTMEMGGKGGAKRGSHLNSPKIDIFTLFLLIILAYTGFHSAFFEFFLIDNQRVMLFSFITYFLETSKRD